ncbi:MAG: DUF2254 domain-containing protein [Caldilineaceae bacterium]
MDVQLRLRAFWDDLQSSLWYRPTIYTLLAIALALINPYIDQITKWEFYSFGADNARAVLTAIASSMLTVVTLTFSILMVSFTLASQQFSPRILRTFTRDRTSQHVLGLQIGTFLYSLLVMVRIHDVGETIFIPLISVLGAIGFSLVGIGAFVYFIDHISRSIRVNYVIANIGEQTVTLLREECSQTAGDEQQPAIPVRPAALQEKSTPIKAKRAGYLQGIAYRRLVEIAHKHDLVLELACMTGDFISVGRPVAHFYPAQEPSAELMENLLNQFDIGTERTMFEDTLFGIRQLVDIALRALSPAVNDPTTAMNCLDYLTNILIQAAACSDESSSLCDEEGHVRLLAQRVGFAALVELAFNQIRHYGSGDVLVDMRMIDALTEIAGATDDLQRRALLWQHVSMVSRKASRKLDEAHDRQQINERIVAAARQMDYDPSEILLDPHALRQAQQTIAHVVE